MCVDNSVPFHSDKPIIAYKVMIIKHRDKKSPDLPVISSYAAGNDYTLGSEYDAEKPLFYLYVERSLSYERGFHAYKRLKAARTVKTRCQEFTTGTLCVVQVELSELTFKGEESISLKSMKLDRVPVYVANKCRFIQIMD